MLTGFLLVLILAAFFPLPGKKAGIGMYPLLLKNGTSGFNTLPARLYKSFQIWDVEVAVSPPQTENPQAAAAKVAAAQAVVTE